MGKASNFALSLSEEKGHSIRTGASAERAPAQILSNPPGRAREGFTEEDKLKFSSSVFLVTKHHNLVVTLCHAIVPPPRKRPDPNRESFKIGHPAGRPTARRTASEASQLEFGRNPARKPVFRP